MHNPFRVLSILLFVSVASAACTSSDDASDTTVPDEGASTGDGTYEAEIVRTTDGVPHITGETLDDVTFGQGWASAEDRSCDLIDQVIEIRGDRSSIFGAGEDDEHLESDLQWRTIGIFDRATKDFTEASADVQALMTSFTAGWNAHLDDVGVDGIAGWCSGEDWVRPVEPDEVYAYARAIALQASSGAVGGFLLGAAPPEAPDDSGTDDEDALATSPSRPIRRATGGRSAPIAAGAVADSFSGIHTSRGRAHSGSGRST